MALTKCNECGETVSTRAAACMKCGAPVASSAPPNAVPVSIERKSPFRWLWIPAGLFAAFMIFGMMIPEQTAKANEFRRACEEFVKKGLSTQQECNIQEDRIRHATPPK